MASYAASVAKEMKDEMSLPLTGTLLHRSDYSDDTLEVLGSGSYRVAFLGSDDVVYKALYSSDYTSLHEYHFGEELAFFDAISNTGFSWAPDYWPYEDYYVMAMRLYHPFRTNPWYKQVDVTAMTSEMDEWCHDVKHDNLGWTSDGRLVLIDGGCSAPSLLQRSDDNEPDEGLLAW
jgi:hypothetical protein